jgi:FMN reductase (NADPH)
MNLSEAINNRRSIRSYTGNPVPDDVLDAIVDAGRTAPIGLARFDSIKITVVKDPKVLAELEEAAGRATGMPDMHCFYGAPCYIVVSAKPDARFPMIGISDAAMIAENMLLKAVELGVGACCVWGPVVASRKDISTVSSLNLDEGFVPSAGIVVGETEDSYEPREVADRIAVDVIH